MKLDRLIQLANMKLICAINKQIKVSVASISKFSTFDYRYLLG